MKQQKEIKNILSLKNILIVILILLFIYFGFILISVDFKEQEEINKYCLNNGGNIDKRYQGCYFEESGHLVKYQVKKINGEYKLVK